MKDSNAGTRGGFRGGPLDDDEGLLVEAIPRSQMPRSPSPRLDFRRPRLSSPATPGSSRLPRPRAPRRDAAAGGYVL
jgi:hypothetical protein